MWARCIAVALVGASVLGCASPGQTLRHAFDFTPSISLFVDCPTAQELDRLFEALSAGGSVFMPPDAYGFSEKFAWVQDKYGVSWQLNLPHAAMK